MKCATPEKVKQNVFHSVVSTPDSKNTTIDKSPNKFDPVINNTGLFIF